MATTHHRRQGRQRRQPGQPTAAEDANDPSHPYAPRPADVRWTYVVKNTTGGNITNVKKVIDDNDAAADDIGR